jgi:glycosyltransferase involved in cell wall biosynthesis
VRFSLVLATVGRHEEVRRFLESLRSQARRDVELVVVDQNADDRIERLCREYSADIQIQVIRTAKTNLSRARNVGLCSASGEIIAFPDDDCEYPKDLLTRVAEYLSQHPEIDGITGVTRDSGGCGLPVQRFDHNPGLLEPGNLWRRHTTASMFLRRRVIESVGLFDEQLGVGSAFGSGEETDLLLRSLRQGFSIVYRPELAVCHPNPVTRFDARAADRAYNYGLGEGAVLRKHLFGRGGIRLLPRLVSYLVRPLAGCLIYSLPDRGKACYYLARLRGRLNGFARYRTERTGGQRGLTNA